MFWRYSIASERPCFTVSVLYHKWNHLSSIFCKFYKNIFYSPIISKNSDSVIIGMCNPFAFLFLED